MNTLSKTTKTLMAATVSTGILLSGMVAAPMAQARPYSPQSAYQCEVTKSNSAKTGAILGAIAGGLLGSQVAKNERGLGAVGGAVLGGVLGNKIGKDQGKDTCLNAQAAADRQYNDNRYYSSHRYSQRYYDERYDNRYASNDDRYGYRR